MIKQMSIIDPACGDGELLIALKNELTTYDIEKNFYGIDKLQNAINKTLVRLDEAGVSAANCTIKKFDSLLMLDPIGGDKQPEFQENMFDVVIANPPWGANLAKIKSKLSCNRYELAIGQYDSADLFVELSLKLAAPNGIIAFILPDSLFSQERQKLREMLIKQTTIHFIGRMGEKFFPNVNRACVILIAQKTPPSEKCKVEILRLTPSLRQKIICGNVDFLEIDKKYCHKINQSRFASDANYKFDIELQKNEEGTVDKIRSSTLTVGDFCESTRGIEISKLGKVIRCNKCSMCYPLPKNESIICKKCSSEISKRSANIISIVSKGKITGYAKLLTGENISRYNINNTLWIQKNVCGINYKNISSYMGKKIVIRKTGVGISAAIDYSEALTTQVVYILKEKLGSKIELEAILGLLNSRAIYYYLAKIYGETEWRSHPYLTQTQILNLPVPHLNERNIAFLKEIAQIVKATSKTISGITTADDAALERLVANVFCLTKQDYISIYKTIETVQDLLPVRALKQISIKNIF
jgi:type I restriction-modification system DNA methylase subunit